MLKEEAEQIGGLRYGKSHPPTPAPLLRRRFPTQLLRWNEGKNETE